MYKILFKSVLNFFFKTLSEKESSHDSLNMLHKHIQEQVDEQKEKAKKKEYNWINKRKNWKTNRRKDVVVYRLVFKVTRNNVFITVIDPLGRYVFYSSGGLNYFFLRRRSVSVANILLGENIGSELKHKFISAVDLEFHGLPFKSHRWNFIKGLIASKVLIRNIVDKTPIAHNGCSRKKRRRKKLKRH